ncbi:hypothetical protein TNIN_442281 [Trichonephila inaurata madagascariensis]|uniref:Uncharacterized protein n=1 Tax=Trichonephila inaurata madagascariensis TaxID=2747483 RepID=A0A8X6IVA6_9ARAC|nr:hypothetical protein TNIN_442281 [Trichonephila inaurata madagascariensis]
MKNENYSQTLTGAHHLFKQLLDDDPIISTKDQPSNPITFSPFNPFTGNYSFLRGFSLLLDPSLMEKHTPHSPTQSPPIRRIRTLRIYLLKNFVSRKEIKIVPNRQVTDLGIR